MSQSNGHNNRKLFESNGSKKPLTDAERYPDQLTPAQERFAVEFLIDLNPSKAAERAGLPPASGQGLLRKPHVWKAIRKKLDKLNKKTEKKAEDVLKELTAIGFSDIRCYFNEDGSPKKIHELSDEAAAAIQSLDVVEIWEGPAGNREFKGYLKKYKLWDKNSALTNLGKIFRLITDRVEGEIKHVHTVGDPELLGRVRERLGMGGPATGLLLEHQPRNIDHSSESNRESGTLDGPIDPRVLPEIDNSADMDPI